jgi:simple sugar transport system ATP-binding protein
MPSIPSRSAAAFARQKLLATGESKSATVLSLIDKVRARGVAVLFITHNAYHAHSAGDRFTILRRGETLASFAKGERTIGEVIELMAGGAELQSLLIKGERLLAGGPAP